MANGDGDAIVIVERVLQLLDEGRFSATYKHALLTALLDLCVEGADAHGAPPQMLTTRQIAEKVIAVYWPHVRVWKVSAPLLRQMNDTRQIVGSDTILGWIHAFRQRVELAGGATAPVVRARALDPVGWNELLDKVEWRLIEMPLPKLQRVGGQDVGWLYRIGWNDHDARASRAAVRAYQRGQPSPFNNAVHLMPGVGMAFARLHAVLRPFLQHHWAEKVASLNAQEVPQAGLHEFLFGVERSSLEPVREGLMQLQAGKCFYCDGRLDRGAVHVDHFLPWARHPDDALANLVAADAVCNGDKRDFLASTGHVERWRERMQTQHPLLEQMATLARWDVGADRVLGAARAMYLALPGETRLWAGRKRWEILENPRLQLALA